MSAPTRVVDAARLLREHGINAKVTTYDQDGGHGVHTIEVFRSGDLPDDPFVTFRTEDGRWCSEDGEIVRGPSGFSGHAVPADEDNPRHIARGILFVLGERIRNA